MITTILKKAFPHLIALLTFIILNSIYFNPQFEGKRIGKQGGGDLVSGAKAGHELGTYRSQTDEDVLWTNAVFGGMPAYQLSFSPEGNQMSRFYKIFYLKFSEPIGIFNLLMVAFYISMLLLGFTPWISMLGAVCFAFTTNNFILLEAGHLSKLRAIAFSPIIIAGVILAFQKKYLLGGAIFAFGMALNLWANHVQMTYYLGLGILIFVLMKTVEFAKRREWIDLLKIGGILIIGLLLAIATSMSNLLPTYEYGEETMRGKPILTSESSGGSAPAQSSSEVAGLEWNYAMQWSNGFVDLLATVIPGAAGGGSGEKISQKSAFAQAVRQRGSRVEAAPLYWGALPFTEGPSYFGVVLSFLFVFGLFFVKGTIKWWLGLAVLLTTLISMGSTLGGFNQFLFDHLPLLNKFRAPTSILGLTVIFVTILVVMALSELTHSKRKNAETLRALKWSSGILGGLLIFFVALGSILYDFTAAVDAQYAQAGLVDALLEDRKSLFRKDAIRSLLFVLLTTGLIWLFVKGKIKNYILVAAIGLLCVIDLWGVGKRYVDKSSFITSASYSENFEPRPIDQQIMNAEPTGRGFYRVFDLSINTFNSNAASHFHNTIGGYHPAKLQRYQDLIDRHISRGNPSVLNMLNTKYIINQQGQLQTNPGALGNVWFVESIQNVTTPNEEIDGLTGLDPANTALVLNGEFGKQAGWFDPQKNGSIELVDYKPHHLTYQSNAASDQLAVFSEIWYGPDKGWNSYIDGEPAEHLRANYVLRAMKVPSGAHQIEFKFEPKSYTFGKLISYSSSILIILLVFGLLGFKGFEQFKALKKSENLAIATSSRIPEKEKKRPAKARRRKHPKKRKRR